MSKGSNFEREICKKLSLWWTNNERDDVFWRTAGSGARATTRFKKGKKTAYEEGDIKATDPIGQPLMDLVSIELKRGYSKDTLSDLIDKPKDSKPSMYEKFIEQAIRECKNQEDGKEWILIVKRDRRDAILFTSMEFFKKIKPFIQILITNCMFCHYWYEDKTRRKIFIWKFQDFLNLTHPNIIKEIWNERKRDLQRNKKRGHKKKMS